MAGPHSTSIKRHTSRDATYASMAEPGTGLVRDRRERIARVIALWPHELADESVPGRRIVLEKLRCALRQERRRGLAGHWCYDLARHRELLHVFRQEEAALATAERTPEQRRR